MYIEKFNGKEWKRYNKGFGQVVIGDMIEIILIYLKVGMILNDSNILFDYYQLCQR